MNSDKGKTTNAPSGGGVFKNIGEASNKTDLVEPLTTTNNIKYTGGTDAGLSKGKPAAMPADSTRVNATNLHGALTMLCNIWNGITEIAVTPTMISPFESLYTLDLNFRSVMQESNTDNPAMLIYSFFKLGFPGYQLRVESVGRGNQQMLVVARCNNITLAEYNSYSHQQRNAYCQEIYHGGATAKYVLGGVEGVEVGVFEIHPFIPDGGKRLVKEDDDSAGFMIIFAITQTMTKLPQLFQSGDITNTLMIKFRISEDCTVQGLKSTVDRNIAIQRFAIKAGSKGGSISTVTEPSILNSVVASNGTIVRDQSTDFKGHPTLGTMEANDLVLFNELLRLGILTVPSYTGSDGVEHVSRTNVDSSTRAQLQAIPMYVTGVAGPNKQFRSKKIVYSEDSTHGRITYEQRGAFEKMPDLTTIDLTFSTDHETTPVNAADYKPNSLVKFQQKHFRLISALSDDHPDTGGLPIYGCTVNMTSKRNYNRFSIVFPLGANVTILKAQFVNVDEFRQSVRIRMMVPEDEFEDERKDVIDYVGKVISNNGSLTFAVDEEAENFVDAWEDIRDAYGTTDFEETAIRQGSAWIFSLRPFNTHHADKYDLSGDNGFVAVNDLGDLEGIETMTDYIAHLERKNVALGRLSIPDVEKVLYVLLHASRIVVEGAVVTTIVGEGPQSTYTEIIYNPKAEPEGKAPQVFDTDGKLKYLWNNWIKPTAEGIMNFAPMLQYFLAAVVRMSPEIKDARSKEEVAKFFNAKYGNNVESIMKNILEVDSRLKARKK